MIILQTERLVLREMDSATDAEFIFELLNTPKFIKYIGDRGLRSVEESAAFIENRYRRSYRDNGFGLYVVELRKSVAAGGTLPTGRVSALSAARIGLCGFVRRDTLPGPDIGFAFLPEFEGLGYGYESANAMMKYGRETLGFTQVLAITSQDNEVSGRLLKKLGFKFDKLMESGEETLKLFTSD